MYKTSELNRHYLRAEAEHVDELIAVAQLDSEATNSITQDAARLVSSVREHRDRLSTLDRFLTEYDLSSSDGVLLMCLAESLLRIPDTATADALIADKLTSTDWSRHLGGEDLLVNATTWGLMLTGRILPPIVGATPTAASGAMAVLGNVIGRLGEPIIRHAIRHAMRIIGDQFVMGQTIEDALERAAKTRASYESMSFDMLGEGAMTQADAERYFLAYDSAIKAIATDPAKMKHRAPDAISIKLSALHPRFEISQNARLRGELGEKLFHLASKAADNNVHLTIDAEESDRLTLTMDAIEDLCSHAELKDWDGLGVAVQAYQKRALDVIRFLESLSISSNRRLSVRLVKGAYWDSEIKLAQIRGLSDYPVFTRKCNTDVSYMAAAKVLLETKQGLYPQFATHNAHTISYITRLAGNRPCEFQRLHGMGEALYLALNDTRDVPYPCRVYAPVGSHELLLPYLLRRLLENGANSSFVHRIADPEVPIEQLVADPIVVAQMRTDRRHANISLPDALFSPERLNSAGVNFSDARVFNDLLSRTRLALKAKSIARPMVAGESHSGEVHVILDPSDNRHEVGEVQYADEAVLDEALATAYAAWPAWDATAADTRAQALERTAELMEAEPDLLLALAMRETGKTIVDAHGELREAVDFLRYYASECRRLFATAITLPGVVGERNQLRWHGRGVFFAISPWNFPLSIFTGQIAAALAAGNTVIAKPAEQASLLAARVVELLHRAGVPVEVLNFIPGDGPRIATHLLKDERLGGVVFTGSYQAARSINLRLAGRYGAIAPFIAETGGINAMIVDSSALPEQVVRDVVASAFNSAGQRCSALRVLYLQEDISPLIVEMLLGHMHELVIGDPAQMSTDIGPLIDAAATEKIREYIAEATADRRLIGEMTLPKDIALGNFIAPCLIKLEHIDQLPGEIFGPVLHVRTFQADQLDLICDEINAAGYGLTCGVHSRIEHRIERIFARVRVGNLYANRTMIGAVVGSQPFGGRGLSGTGPKAGGPNYLLRFATEQTHSLNTAAIGGNAALISLDEDGIIAPDNRD